MRHLLSTSTTAPKDTVVKIALLLPAYPSRRILRKGRALTKSLLQTQSLAGETVEVVVGLVPLTDVYWKEESARFTALGERVSVRRLHWERIPFSNAKRMFFAYPRPSTGPGIDSVILPRDFGENFLDCSFWFNIADLRAGAVYGVRPMANFLLEPTPRQVPEAFPHASADPYWALQTEAFRSFRMTGLVVTEGESDAAEWASYAGIRRDDVMAVGELYTPAASISTSPHHASRLLWRVEPDPIYDFERAAAGLQRYLNEGGSMSPVLLSELPEEGFRKGSNIPLVAGASFSVREMLHRLPYRHYCDENDIARALATSAYVWDSAVFAMAKALSRDALFAGLPLLSAEVPGWEASEGATFLRYRSDNAHAIADALHELERFQPHAPALHEDTLADVTVRIGFVLDRLWEMSDA
ncbi:hypothetical protein [Sphingomonas elodea]|uniref:hypothetical protein n=1 Tax=Sphingomonas elodea TaxID=179878 RepID=UPI000263100A|nr:hypothetical protein [Sphingomonas elodea]